MKLAESESVNTCVRKQSNDEFQFGIFFIFNEMKGRNDSKNYIVCMVYEFYMFKASPNIIELIS